MYCPQCGKELPDDSIFCEYCGARVDDEMAEKPVTETPKPEASKPAKPSTTGMPAPKSKPVSEPARVSAPKAAQTKKSRMPIIIGVAAVAVIALIAGLAGKGKGSGKPQEKAEKQENTTFFELAEETEEAPEQDVASAVIPEGEDAAEEAAETDEIEEELPEDAYDEDVLPEDVDLDIAGIVDLDENGDPMMDMTFTEMDEIAANLSTEKIAGATDFEWAQDYVLYGGTGSGRIIADTSYSEQIRGDMTDLLAGGWKAYMFATTGDGAFDPEGERFFNAEIIPDGRNLSMNLNWGYVIFGGETITEEGNDYYEGVWDQEYGTAELNGSFMNVYITEWYLANDHSAEYALGTCQWASGEWYNIALMR